MDYPGVLAALADLGDNTATISVKSVGGAGTLMTGEVDELNFDLIGRTINFTGRDKSSKLHDMKSTDKWVNQKPSDVVQSLIGRAGLSGKVTPSKTMAGKKLQQDYVKLTDNASLAQIIHKMAEIDGCRWWVDPQGTFHYVPFNDPSGIYSVYINQSQPILSDCMSLKVRRNIQAGKSQQVTVKSWHPKQKKVFTHKSTVSGNGGPIVYSYDFPTLLQPDVMQRAKAIAMERALHEFVIEAKVVGDPSIAAGMGLELSGSVYFDQVYTIDTVVHNFGRHGYTTHMTSKAPKEGRSAS